MRNFPPESAGGPSKLPGSRADSRRVSLRPLYRWPRRAWAPALFACLFFSAAELSAACPEAYWQPGASELDLGGQWRVQLSPGRVETPPATLAPEYDDSGWRALPVPADFSDYRARPGAQGLTGIFRCRITLAGPPPEGVAVYLGVIEEADAVYFNGVLVGETGSLRTGEVDVEKARLYPLPANLWREGANTLTVRVFSSNADGGLRHPPRILGEQAQERRLLLIDMPNIVLSSSYILVAAFFAIFFVFFLRQYENLYFALFSLFLGLYSLIRSRMRYEWFDSFERSYQTELMLLFSLPVFFLEFLHHTTKRKRSLPVKLLYACSGALLVFIAFAPSRPYYWDKAINFNLIVIIAALGIVGFIFVRTYREHRDKLRYLLGGFIVLTPIIILDVLNTVGLLPTGFPRVVVFGFALFLFFASLQLSDTILRLYKNIHEQELELRQLEKRKTRSVLNISNEFNSILGGFREGLAGLSGAPAKKAPDTGRRRNGRASAAPEDRLRTSTVNLENLTLDSRLLYALENGEYQPRLMRFSLKKLGADVISRALIAAEQSKSRVSAILPGDEVEVTSDPDLLAAALFHLVENALLYSTGKVEVALESRGGLVICAVRDEGPGMTAELQKTVFQKFVRGAPDDYSGPAGSGIGLTIVDLIADALGGDVRIEGGGFFSTFVLTIPSASEALR